MAAETRRETLQSAAVNRGVAAIPLELLCHARWSAFCTVGRHRRNPISWTRAVFETTAATGIDHIEATSETSASARSVRDEFETIWRIAGLPPSHLTRYPDGTYKATYAMRAWEIYAVTREWRAVLGAAKPSG